MMQRGEACRRAGAPCHPAARLLPVLLLTLAALAVHSAAAARPGAAGLWVNSYATADALDDSAIMIVVLKHRSHLAALRELCSSSFSPSSSSSLQTQMQAFNGSSDTSPSASAVCGAASLGGSCLRLLDHTIIGVVGRFVQSQVDALHGCLADGIAYIQQDAQVHKAESSDHEYSQWWTWGHDNAAEQPAGSGSSTKHASSTTTVTALDGPLDGSIAVEGFGSSSASTDPSMLLGHAELQSVSTAAGSTIISSGAQSTTPQQVVSSDGSAAEASARDAAQRQLLARVGLDAQAQLAGGAEPVLSLAADEAPAAMLAVDPKQISSPGIVVDAAEILDAQSLAEAISLPGRKVQRLPQALWNLDRLDQRALPLDRTYALGSNVSAGTGQGVTIYTIDSGIIPTHQEFRAWAPGAPTRAILGPSFVSGGNLSIDCDGHGTHIASTAAGRAVGVAKEAHVVGVQVLDCEGSGTISDVVSALDWVAANAVRPAVVTMSLGVSSGTWSRALEDAVTSLVVDHNITVVVAAGNSAADSCGIAPARAPEAISVGGANLATKFGATAAGDAEGLYRWSNTGACVDVFAPGVDIYGACGGAERCEAVTDNAYTWASGTSMAVPHVAGAAAIFLQQRPGATPREVRRAILQAASRGFLHDARVLPGTPNTTLYTGLLADAVEVAALPPVPDQRPPQTDVPQVMQMSEAATGSTGSFASVMLGA